MGYSNDAGYTPVSIQDLMSFVMININTQFGTSYTEESFLGTAFYKYFYAIAQKMQENEIKTSEIFLKLQTYFTDTNERILRPKTTPDGLVDTLKLAGYTASVKPPINDDAGKLFLCVDVDDTDEDYEDQKLEIATIMSETVIAGIISQGAEDQNIVISNGQEFTYKYDLPTRIEVLLRLTLTISRNNSATILTDAQIKTKLMDNIAAKYSLGKDFEPETYFTIVDAPWCSDILLEYSVDDGENWDSAVYESEYDELFEIALENITLIQS